MEAHLIQPGAVGNTAESTPATASTSAQTEEVSGIFASELEQAIQSEGTQPGDSTQVQAENSGPAEVAEQSTEETTGQNPPITNVVVEDPTAFPSASNLTESTEPKLDPDELEIGASSGEEPTAEDALDGDAGLSHPEHVDQNTSRHFSTLENVLSRVPESARPAIEHALQVSVNGNESALGSLRAQEGTTHSGPVIDGTVGESESLVEGTVSKLAAATETATSVLEQTRTRVAAPAETAFEGALQAVRGDGASSEVAASVLEGVHNKDGEQAKPALESALSSRGQGTGAANAIALQAVRGDGASSEVAASVLEEVHNKVGEQAKPALESALSSRGQGTEAANAIALQAVRGDGASSEVAASVLEGVHNKDGEQAKPALESALSSRGQGTEAASPTARQAVRGDVASSEVAASVLEGVHNKDGEQAKPALESVLSSRGQGTEAASPTARQAVRGDGASNEVAASVLEGVHNKVGEQAKPALESALSSRGQGTEAANPTAEIPVAITTSTSISGKDSNIPAPQSADADTRTADDAPFSSQVLRSGVPLQAKSSHQAESPLPNRLQESANSENASQAIPSTSHRNQGEKASTDGPSLPAHAAVPDRVELPFENATVATPNPGGGNSTSQARRGSGQGGDQADVGTGESAGSLEVDAETSPDTSQTRKNDLPGAQKFVVTVSNSSGSQGEHLSNSGEQSGLTAPADIFAKSTQARSLSPTAKEAGPSTTSLEQAAPPEFNPHNQMGRIVNSARVMEQLGRAEMHVSLRTEALGPVDFHTVVRNGEVGALIGAERQEARVALTGLLPALEQALTDRSLRVDNLTVSDRWGGAESGFSQSSNPDANPFARQQGNPSRWPWALTAEGTSEVTLEGWDLGEGHRRLSVHV